MTYPLIPGARERDTSFAAAQAIAPKAQTLRELCMTVFHAEDGLTADEVAENVRGALTRRWRGRVYE